jgi:hypothetical protein
MPDRKPTGGRESMQKVRGFAILVFLCVFLLSSAGATEPPTPESFFGFKPGADRKLFDYEQLIEYLQKVADSPRLELREIGASPMGRPMYVALISNETNLQRLDELVAINEKLALDPDLEPTELERLTQDGRVFVLLTLSMHSGEVAPAQSLPLFAYEMVTTDDPELLHRLDQVVLMIVPNHNPDGMNMVVNHYQKYLGTKYEGTSLPGVYHKYVGHDNNRDFITLSQTDTKAISRIFSTEWYPQVMCEKHQMGRTGPRYYVPPNHDPIAENIPADLWRWSGLFGANLAKDMGRDGLTGVAQHWMFDEYWPGSTETSVWKNVISFLTEAASCGYATPVRVEANELSVRGKGLSEYEISVNMHEPWPGGWWRLGDIVEYELSSNHSILATAAQHRASILKVRNDLCRNNVKLGQTQAPYYFILPAKQRDRSELKHVAELLQEHGVEVKVLNNSVKIDGRLYSAGDIVVPLSQPYRPFVKEVLEQQVFPVRHYTPGGEVIRPYDITSWSLPLHYGVETHQIDTRSKDLEAKLEPWTVEYTDGPSLEGAWAVALRPHSNAAFEAVFGAFKAGIPVARVGERIDLGDGHLCAGSFVFRVAEGKADQVREIVAELGDQAVVIPEKTDLPMKTLRAPRIGLVETYFHDMDAGWTRFVFDDYKVPYKVLRPGDFAETNLVADFDVIVFPDSDSSVIENGKYKRGDDYSPSEYPPEYREGLGDKGMKRLMSFLDQGGIIVSWRRSTELFTRNLKIERGEDEKEEFKLPVNDISDRASKGGLYVPGAWLAFEVKSNDPLTWGMPSQTGVFSRGTPVFSTSLPSLDMDRRVIGVYPKKNILKSGYIENEKQLANRTGMVWLRKGKGQLVLYGFNPQFRASTPATYKLLFNALLLPKLAGDEPIPQ